MSIHMSIYDACALGTHFLKYAFSYFSMPRKLWFSMGSILILILCVHSTPAFSHDESLVPELLLAEEVSEMLDTEEALPFDSMPMRILSQRIDESRPSWFKLEMALQNSNQDTFILSYPESSPDHASLSGDGYIVFIERDEATKKPCSLSLRNINSEKLLGRAVCSWDSSGRNLLSLSFYNAVSDTPECSHAFIYDDEGRVIKHTLSGSLSGTRGVTESYTTNISYGDDRRTVRLVGDDKTVTTVRQVFSQGSSLDICCIEGSDGTCVRKILRTCEEESIENDHPVIQYMYEEIEDDSPSVSEIETAPCSWRRWKRTISRAIADTELSSCERVETVEIGAFDPCLGTDVLLRKTRRQYSKTGELVSYEVYDGSGSLLFASQHGLTPEFFTLRHSRNAQDAHFLCSGSIGEQVIDGLGRIQTYIEQCENGSHFVENKYDSFGNTLSLQKEPSESLEKEITRFRGRYTARSLIAAKEFSDGSQETFRYLLNGQLSRHKSKDNQTVTYLRDGIGRPICILKAEKGATQKDRTEIKYERGSVAYILQSPGRETFLQRDIFDRVVEYRHSIDGILSQRYRVVYDALDRIVALTAEGENEYTISCTYHPYMSVKETRCEKKTQGALCTLLCRETYSPEGKIKEKLIENQQEKNCVEYFYDDKEREVLVRYSSLDGTYAPYSYVTDYADIGEEDAPHKGEAITIATTKCPDGSLRREKRISSTGRMLERLITKERALAAASNTVDDVVAIHEQWETLDTNGSQRHTEKITLSSGRAITKVYVWHFGPNKRLVSISSPDGEVAYTYDARGNIIEKRITGHPALYYERTPKGQITRLSSADGSIDYRYEYDVKGRIIACTDAVHKKRVVRSFDTKGRLISDGEEGRQISLRYTDGLSTSRKAPQACILPDGARIDFIYSSPQSSQPTSIVKKGGQGRFSSSWSLPLPEQGKVQETHALIAVSHTGKMIEKTESHPLLMPGKINKGPKKTWGERKTRIITDSFGYISSEQGEFEYNVSFMPSGDCTAYSNQAQGEERNGVALDEKGRTIRRGRFAFSYDSRGNLSSLRHYDIEGNPDQDLEYRYDALGRIVALNDKIAGAQEIYRYDGFHRIQSIKILGPHTSQGHEKSKTRKEQQVDRLWFSLSDLGSVTYDSDRAEPQACLRVPSFCDTPQSTLAIEIDGAPYATITDTSHSIVGLIDASSTLVEEYRYSMFGDLHSYNSMGGKVSQPLSPWLYNGKRSIGSGSLYDFGMRRFSPALLHWLEKDPIGAGDGLHDRAFVQNNPLGMIDPTGLFSVAFYWWKLVDHISDSTQQVCSQIMKSVTFASTSLDWFFQFRALFEDLAFRIVSSTWMKLIGYNPDATRVGCAGGTKELHPKVRVTHINGILNGSKDQVDNAALVSKCHGNIPVHYVYAATSGFTGDLLRCAFAKGGIVSRQARLLAQLWRRLIRELGGPSGGGLIIHYAHSLGGTDTSSALTLMTLEERACIRIITFGSATLIKEGACQQVDNFVSVNDGVPVFDTRAYVSGLMGWQENIHFLSSTTLPAIDHLFTNETYRRVLEDLGNAFQENYLKSQSN